MERRTWTRLLDVVREEFNSLPERIRRENAMAQDVHRRLQAAESSIERLEMEQGRIVDELRTAKAAADTALACVDAFNASDEYING